MSRSSPRGHAFAVRGAVLAAALLSGCGAGTGGPPAASPGGAAPAAFQAPVSGGRELYMYYCAKCHGITGLGDGPSVGSLRTQEGLNLALVASKSDEEILDTVAGGKGGDMPPWELKLTVEQRGEILGFVRGLAKR